MKLQPSARIVIYFDQMKWFMQISAKCKQQLMIFVLVMHLILPVDNVFIGILSFTAQI